MCCGILTPAACCACQAEYQDQLLVLGIQEVEALFKRQEQAAGAAMEQEPPHPSAGAAPAREPEIAAAETPAGAQHRKLQCSSAEHEPPAQEEQRGQAGQP